METKNPNLVKTPINESTNSESKRVHASETKLKESQNKSVDSETMNNKGTETLKNDEYHSEHVKEGDNPARQPDRRDQQGETPFDDNINDDTVNNKATLTEQPQSEEITDQNRYATIDNAQTRVLNEDLK